MLQSDDEISGQVLRKRISLMNMEAIFTVWNQQNDQLPVGSLAQLVEQCTGIAKVMD